MIIAVSYCSAVSLDNHKLDNYHTVKIGTTVLRWVVFVGKGILKCVC